VLLVAGKFDEAKALPSSPMLSARSQADPRAPEQWTVEPTQDGEREFRIRRKGEIQIVALAYKVPSGLHPTATAFRSRTSS